MNSIKKRRFTLAALVLVLCSCSDVETKEQHIVFMENVQVFESFQMKLDYDKKMEQEMKNETSKMDSLTILLNKGGFADSMDVYRLRKEYYVTEQIFNTKFEQLSTQYTKEVNDRLNGYIEEFAKQNKYNLILGGNGNGTVMYVDKKENITDALIEFINAKYSK
ncbi:MAG: hypothetical protein A3D92_21615 [Bacteroidetes bacterium RIFCSPHIGHO2_02_FULL_44_7]|nr:MAG: hypothetical protein A3D92_21615 [Bacteroidetes bacterium RIFCSPHIGHO2_02_FULL_44_7]